jgi:N-acetylglucosamine kinase-like BadF-type ATPase
MSDGRLPEGPLRPVLRRALGLSADQDVIQLVLTQWRGARHRIASISPAVVEAARLDDEHAAAILVDAADELVALAEATAHELGYHDDEMAPVSYSGGIFTVPEVRERFIQGLHAWPRRFDPRPPLFSPVIGAALYAAELAGVPLSAAARSRLRTAASGPTQPVEDS